MRKELYYTLYEAGDLLNEETILRAAFPDNK